VCARHFDALGFASRGNPSDKRGRGFGRSSNNPRTVNWFETWSEPLGRGGFFLGAGQVTREGVGASRSILFVLNGAWSGGGLAGGVFSRVLGTSPGKARKGDVLLFRLCDPRRTRACGRWCVRFEGGTGPRKGKIGRTVATFCGRRMEVSRLLNPEKIRRLAGVY